MSAAREVTAPVRRVTVFEDRAQVRRSVELELPAGLHCLRVDQVSPLVVDRTLRGAVSGPAVLRQVTVRRLSSVRSSRPELERELGEEIDRLRQTYLHEFDRQRAAEAEQKFLQRSLGDWLQICALEAGQGSCRKADWAAGLLLLEQRLDRVEEEIQSARAAADELAEQLEQLGERYFLARQPTSDYWARLEAVVEVNGGGPCLVGWDYLVPCALWRPVHRAELDEELRWTLGAMVWQRTGEEWDGVQLCLSTARPTAGAKVPLLEEDLLHIRPKTEAEQSAVAVESRQDEIAALPPQAPSGGSPQVPGVDDAGEVRRFQLAGPVSVPSDGRAHLFVLGSFSSPVALDRICCPELSGQVVLRSRQTNTGRHPLLAGPVTLLRDGGFSGRTTVGFTAPNQGFELGWGTLEGVYVVRRCEEKEEDLAMGRGVRRRTRIRLFLSNTSREPQQLQLVERIPVAELAEVRVRLVEGETSPGARPDANGYLRWDLELPPSSYRELALVYDIESSRRVVWR